MNLASVEFSSATWKQMDKFVQDPEARQIMGQVQMLSEQWKQCQSLINNAIIESKETQAALDLINKSDTSASLYKQVGCLWIQQDRDDLLTQKTKNLNDIEEKINLHLPIAQKFKERLEMNQNSLDEAIRKFRQANANQVN